MSVSEYSRDEYAPSGAYDVSILNVMGRHQKSARNKLYAEAIKNPDGYISLRDSMETLVIDENINRLYKMFKSLLLSGTDEEGNQIFTYVDGRAYAPRLPEATITKFAIRASETLEKILEEAMEEVYPEGYGDLAKKKSAELTRATVDRV